MVVVLEAELLYLYWYLRQPYIIIPLLQALLTIYKKPADFPFIVKYRCQFVADLEDAELLCTIVSDTGTGTIILPQAPLQLQ